jgi:PAS domain S-box-containing protein
VSSKPAIRSIPLTWGDDIHPAAAAGQLPGRLPRPPLPKELAGYAICFGCVLAATAVTRVTWPLFSRTPFVLFVLANFFAARYGNETGALLAIIVSAFGASIAPPAGAPPADPIAIIVLVSGSLFLNRIVIGRNHVETALRASEAQFRAAWDNSTFGAALLNRRGMVDRINPAMERTLGYPSAAWTGVSFGYFSHPDDQAEERARFTAFIDGDEEWYHREQRYRRADGGIIWCRATMSATHDGNGGPRTGALMVLEDVSRRRRAEDDLRKWESRYRGLFDQAPLGLFQCAVDGRLLSVNPAFLALVGHAAVGDVRGAVLTDFVAEREARSAIHEALAAGGRLTARSTVLVRKDGGQVSAVLELRPVRTDEGVLEYLDGSARES